MESSEAIFQKFCNFLAEKIGLDFSKSDVSDFQKKFKPMFEAFGLEDPIECMVWLMETPLTQERVAKLARYLTIGETYFFRDKGLFGLLEEKILPQMISTCHGKGKKMRIWSAGCCTGEEPYSVAIVLHRLIPNLMSWDIQILGTDLNREFLEEAKQACYPAWSFRATPAYIRDRYFVAKEGQWQLIPEIKRLVKYESLNLVQDYYPNEMDLILCNNVLMYFSPQQVQKTVHRLSGALSEGSYLCVTPIEVPYVQDEKLVAEVSKGMTTFRKKGVSQGEPLLEKPVEVVRGEEEKGDFEEVKSPYRKKQISTFDKKAVLKARAEQLALPIQTKNDQAAREVIAFKLAEEFYAIETKYTRGVHFLKDLTFLPSVPKFVSGLMSVRRKIYSVIDLKVLFELPEKEGNREVIILESNEMEFGLLTDGIIEVQSISTMSIQPPPNTLMGIRLDFLLGIGPGNLIILDGSKLLSHPFLVVDGL